MRTKMIFGVLFAASVLLATTCQAAVPVCASTCPSTDKCPTGYEKICNGQGPCGYVCLSPARLNCDPRIAKPRICGGNSGKICPAVACSSSYSYAVSGPAGCAAAYSKVSAVAYPATDYKSSAITADYIQDYCTADPTMSISAGASEAAELYATAVAKTLIHYNSYVCNCCPGNSEAYTVVAADVQAVAVAQAESTINLFAIISPCLGEYLSAASAEASAFAKDVQVAIDSVYKKIVANQYECSVNALNAAAVGQVYTQMQQAIARATVCTFAKVFAMAVDAHTPGHTYSCDATAAITGGLADGAVCNLNFNPCST